MRQLPFLVDYDEFWPVEIYVRKRLARTRYTQKRRIQRIARPLRPARVTKPQGSHQSTSTSGDFETDTGADSDAYSDGNAHSNSDADADLDVDSDTDLDADPDADYEAPSSPEVPLASLYHEQPIVSSFEVHKEEVDTFLHGLQPDMRELSLRFIEAGLVNLRCLIALANMPTVEMQQLLRDDMKLTAFQTRIICIGLAQVCGSK